MTNWRDITRVCGVKRSEPRTALRSVLGDGINLVSADARLDAGNTYAFKFSSGLLVRIDVDMRTVSARQITLTSPGRDLASRDLRSLPLGRLLQAIRMHVQVDERLQDVMAQTWLRDPLAAASAAAQGRTGRPPKPLQDYADVARRALALEAKGYGRARAGREGLTERLAAELGAPEPTVRGWLRKAREHHFLAETVPGRSGFFPGPALTRRGSRGATQEEAP